MTKVILQVYPSMGGVEEMKRLRPIGRNSDAYQNTLSGLVELVKAADELGYWGITHVEHHFHSEGLENSPSPLLLNAYLGQYTKKLNHGQLGIVLPTHDPIRLAEEAAMVDHMLKGRFFVGLARGYQARWQNIIGQKFNVTSTSSDKSEADRNNRIIFEEHYKIMKMAWTEDLLKYDGPTYKIPNPIDGIPNWPPTHSTTLPYGTPGEVDENGTIKAVSVVPSPYTKPHPKLFQAFGASERTLKWCGEEDISPTILWGPMDGVEKLIRSYQEGAASRGRTVGFGENVGLCRTFHIVNDRSELYEAVEKYEKPVWEGWYKEFGFMEGTRFTGEEGPVPKPGEHMMDRLTNSGILLGGTVDDVKRQVEAVLNRVPNLEYFVWLFHWGLIPREEGLKQLELFATKVMPEFGMTYDVPAEVAK
ncbi:LLM class flavin-dependent oxidoreductase [Mesobacillus harenae]|uniref:LLM class flavin-dependent oxidoreductase n=1 Tax=Mesobacillus harenae TaxID=2213203 RepID=UPI0015801E5D|nr:LLM class flavin-dependent oxidoreductase [Mesobacillus harenae]